MTDPRRTHALTPLIQAVPAFPIAFVFLLGPGRDLVASRGLGVVLLTLGGALLGYLGLAGVSWLLWSRRTFWIDADGDLRVDSGVVERSSRRLQLSRLQSVDVVAPIFARLAGLVEVRVEAAGTSGSRVILRYLSRADADLLRRMILELSRRTSADPRTSTESGTSAESGTAAESQVVEEPWISEMDLLASVPPGRLMGSLLLRSVTATLLLLSVLLLGVTSATQGGAGLILVVITGGLPILSVVGEFLSNYGFRVDRSREGLRIRQGLLSTKTRTIPPERVHAVAVVSPLLWRRRGWVRVTVTIAGVEGDASRSGPEVLIPVAPRLEALALIAEVLPGVDVDALPFVSAPPASRWRSPFAWRALAVAITAEVIATRYGRITSTTAIAPHSHVQSVRVTQGAWERRLGLASLHADTAPGPVRVVARHLDQAVVRPLADQEMTLVHGARGSSDTGQ